ncbi:MAG: hypothetical protein KGL39_47125 [Patescibacteria group bacterium]|nr:hypothetical protein [Patescibacteria group bacterium]
MDDTAECQVVSFDGNQAICKVCLDGIEVPRVGFPAWAIKRFGLGVGGRFIWNLRRGTRIRLSDIDPNVRQNDEWTPEEQAEFDRLAEELQRILAEDGGVWPLYTGPGE